MSKQFNFFWMHASLVLIKTSFYKHIDKENLPLAYYSHKNIARIFITYIQNNETKELATNVTTTSN